MDAEATTQNAEQSMNQPPQMSNGDLIKLFQAFQVKIDAMSMQQVHLGLFVEYMGEAIARAVNDAGEPLINIDTEAFPAWAEVRFSEIQKQAAEVQQKQSSVPEGVNLNE